MSESSKPVDLSTHPLVAGLHPDPDDFTNLATFTGYIGPSKKDGHIRLYLDLTFKHYYELPSDAVLDSRPSKADDPQSPTIVTVNARTKLTAVSVSTTDTEASFLNGAISSGYLPAATQGRHAAGPAADCACIGFSAVNTLAGAAGRAADCACVFASAVGNTLAGAAGRGADCACVAFSAIGNTLAGAAGPLCCNPTYTAATCTRQGPSIADARALGCIQLTGTTVCTPTGVLFLCPGVAG